jgi:hypothetical protein
MHQVTNGVPMENEATLEKIGDSQMTSNSADETATCDEHESEGVIECTNGVCVLNWKPTRSAA